MLQAGQTYQNQFDRPKAKSKTQRQDAKQDEIKILASFFSLCALASKILLHFERKQVCCVCPGLQAQNTAEQVRKLGARYAVPLAARDKLEVYSPVAVTP
jgi:hypothetical protein